ncbi:MAG: hypothetical protein A2474_07655 [Elusimicrobia bacterium RIFOXYC2_FULL_34_12]|nr:MAG: hypothetical protein A2474_07655 [Elusimicrobia bacterium RIFOXYC2_FULL_34_12]OGS38555.1 MAG: hypothetical protein A2551_05965 [Elusimicrobia bacterium RIFOXYD2_FULL_34_30]
MLCVFTLYFYAQLVVKITYIQNKSIIMAMGILNELYENIGKIIRNARKTRGLTLEGLAEKVGRDWSFLSQIERGKSIPSIETLFLICRVLEIPVSDLFKSSKTYSYKIDSEIDKLIWLLKDTSPSDKKMVTNVVKQILKRKKNR